VVIEDVEDLHLGAVGEVPKGDVGLPELVGEVSLEADEGGAWPLVGLGRNQALAGEDAPDGGDSGDFGDQGDQVMGDGLGAGVMAVVDQAMAEAEDGGFGLRIDLVRAGAWAARARLQGLVAALAEAGDELVDPASGDPVLLSQLSRTAALL
jgi:hypothetical protein